MANEVVTETQVLSWTLGGKLFGIDIVNCREVDKDKKVLQVPHSADHIAGIVNLRGDVVTVIDLRKLLGYEPAGEKNKNVIIRLKCRGVHVAVMADAIHDVIPVRKDQYETTPANLSEQEERYIQAVAMTDKGLVVILNPDEILKAV